MLGFAPHLNPLVARDNVLLARIIGKFRCGVSFLNPAYTRLWPTALALEYIELVSTGGTGQPNDNWI